MRNTILRILYGTVLFCTVFLLLVAFSEDDGTQTTTQLQDPVLPIVSMDTGSTVFNVLHGVVTERDAGSLRPPLTPLSSEREILLRIEASESTVTGLTVEARDLTGDRLIETLQPELTAAEDGTLTAQISFRNLVEPDTEYLMVILLSTQEQETVYYYTRFTWSEDTAVQEEAEEALAFALAFHEATFGSEESGEYLSYLEPDDDEENDTYACVTLQSSEEMVSWGDLNPEKVTEPVYTITDLQGETYGIRGTYYIRTVPEEDEEGTGEYLYRVEEYYELQKGTQRFYLMDYSRTVSQDFDPQNLEGTDGELNLGIADADLQVVQDDTGDTTAFVHDGRLFAVQESGKLMIYVFGFDSPGDTGERETFAEHDIRIMNVDEDGSIDFLVYGYMNTGSREGEIGISFYHYSGEHRTLEEKVYIPFEGSWELLRAGIDRVCYYNREESCLYLVLNDSLYEIDTQACSIRTAAENLFDSSTQVSADGQLIACAETVDGEETGRILLLDLDGMIWSEIEAEDGQTAIPLGFLGEDLIYGTADASDAVQDSAGLYVRPMSHIYIVDNELNVLEDYHREGVYITSIEIEENQVTLTRVEKTSDPDSPYSSLSEDQIVSSREEDDESYTQTTSTERYENTVQVVFGDIDTESLRYIRPQELSYEGSRELTVRTDGAQQTHYYAYSCSGLMDEVYTLQDAIELAAESSTGVVVDGDGACLWRNCYAERAEIDALTQMPDGAASVSSVQACLEAVLTCENISADVAALLEEGLSAVEILERELGESAVCDLSGCSMEEVLYFVSEYTPVYAMTGTDSAVLIIGYGPENVELYDPGAGSVYLVTRTEAQTMFEEAGNRYISYIRTD